MKKIISFCLWGDNPKYTIGAIKNADLALDIYPEWVCRYYIGKSTPFEIVKQLYDRKNTEIIVMNENGNWNGMFWRFSPASDFNVEVMISRDTDSRLSSREKNAVDEWLQSDKGFHIMRDHPAHQTAILGGLWGAKNGCISNIIELMSEYSKGDFWQVDQNFLKEKIYPLVKDDCFVHDEFFDRKPFPTPREGGVDHEGNPENFIGKPVDENDKRIR
jgi:protein O-GlcNAc transferase